MSKEQTKSTPKRIVPQKPTTNAQSPDVRPPDVMGKIKKNRSSVIIWSALILLLVIYMVSYNSDKKVKYDVYALESAIDINALPSDISPFMTRIAEINKEIGALANAVGNYSDIDLLKISGYHTEILHFDVPSEMSSVKAAELDLLNYHYQYFRDIQNNTTSISILENEKISDAKAKLAQKIGQVI